MKMPGNKKPDSIIILSAAVLIITLIIGTVFIYTPFLNKNKSLRARILKERDRNVLIGNIGALGKHLDVYEKRMSKDKGISWLLSKVSDMAIGQEIEVTSIEPGTPEAQDLYTRLYVIMETVSTYNQLGRFISRVESSEKFLRIEEIDIRRLDIDGKFGGGPEKFESFDVKSRIIISTVIFKE